MQIGIIDKITQSIPRKLKNILVPLHPEIEIADLFTNELLYPIRNCCPLCGSWYA